MGKFLTELDVRVKGNRSWILLEPLKYKDNDSIIHIVPKGTHTDFASVWKVPILALLFAGKCNKESVLHDYYYRTGHTSRLIADKLYKETIINNQLQWSERKRKIIANIIYFGVRYFAKSSYQGKKEWSK